MYICLEISYDVGMMLCCCVMSENVAGESANTVFLGNSCHEDQSSRLFHDVSPGVVNDIHIIPTLFLVLLCT